MKNFFPICPHRHIPASRQSVYLSYICRTSFVTASPGLHSRTSFLTVYDEVCARAPLRNIFCLVNRSVHRFSSAFVGISPGRRTVKCMLFQKVRQKLSCQTALRDGPDRLLEREPAAIIDLFL